MENIINGIIFDDTEYVFDSNVYSDMSDADLNIGDSSGYVIAEFKSGHIKTKNFDSRNSSQSLDINLNGKTILLYGDSITSTDYSWYKDELEQITGATVINNGHSGWSTAQLAQKSALNTAVNLKPDVCFILVGGNDKCSQGTVGTFGTYGGLLESETIVNVPDISSDYSGSKYIESVAYITNYLTYHIGGYRHTAYLSGLCNDVGVQLSNENDLDNLPKPIVVLCTSLPQQRTIQGDDEWKNIKNNKRKADACREVSQLLNVPLLDFSTRCGFDLINEDSWVPPTDKVHNKGTYMMDGLHPNKFGYRRMARLAYDFIRPYFIQ